MSSGYLPACLVSGGRLCFVGISDNAARASADALQLAVSGPHADFRSTQPRLCKRVPDLPPGAPHSASTPVISCLIAGWSGRSPVLRRWQASPR